MVFLPQTPESFTRDADGSQLSDGRWSYERDGENPQPAWALISTTKFVWDGWTVAAELDGNDAVVRTFAWGADVSGREQGAGGVGALLFQTEGPTGPTRHALYDGNGNVTSMRDDAGAVAAAFEYGPFGETLTARGDAVGSTPFRFSTKYTDPESGLLYYGHRYYNPSTGRWLSRDPIGEAAGPNVYAFVRNMTVMLVDPLGLQDYRLGADDPPIRFDPGAGEWNSDVDFDYLRSSAFVNSLYRFVLPTMERLLWPDAAAHLRHYLGNTGNDYTIRLRNMVNEVDSAKELYKDELEDAIRYVETLGPGTHRITSSKASSGYNRYKENKNWYYAVGGYHAWGKGTATVYCGDDGTREYVLVFVYKFADKYNWDTGKSTNIAGVTITDDYMGSLHRQGLAREFIMKGEMVDVYRWKAGESPVPVTSQPPPGGRGGRGGRGGGGGG